MANHKTDIIDILADASHGYQGAAPRVIVEDKNKPFSSFLNDNIWSIIIRKDLKYSRNELNDPLEDRIWDHKVSIIAPTDDILDTTFTEVREVFNRYNTDRTNFDALTTGNSYSYARVTNGIQDPRSLKNVQNIIIQLVEEVVTVEE